MIDWHIQSRAHVCHACGKGFHHHDLLHTLLFDERQGYQRLDVCEPCWASQYAQAANHRKGFVSHWVGNYEPPPASSPDPIQKESAETLLRKLLAQNDRQHAGAVFILAVMLERKRLLKVKAQHVESGQRVFIYEHARTGDVFTILDPDLQLDQLEIVQRDVASLLEHGLDTPPAAGALGETGPPTEAESVDELIEPAPVATAEPVTPPRPC